MQTFEELLLDYFFEHKLRPSTEKAYRCAIRQLLHYRDISPQELTRELLLEWRAESLQQGLRKVSWNHYIRHIKVLIKFGQNHGRLSLKEDIFKGMTLKEPKKRKKILTQCQLIKAEKLIRLHIDSERCGLDSELAPVWFWYTVMMTFRCTGIRLNQLLHIRLCDISLVEKMIHLTDDGSKAHKEHVVPISSKLIPLYEVLLKQAKTAGMTAKSQLFNVNRFHPKYQRDTMDDNQVQHFFAKLSELCQFKISSHRFRHTIATELMKHPERNMFAVKDLLGHSDIKTTCEYIEPDMDVLRECVERI